MSHFFFVFLFVPTLSLWFTPLPWLPRRRQVANASLLQS